MDNDTDWRAITIKFKGRCIECGREISPGQEALWSRSMASIKHLETCSIKDDSKVTANEDGKEPRYESKEHSSRQRRYVHTSIPKCFICGKEKSREDKYNFDDP